MIIHKSRWASRVIPLDGGIADEMIPLTTSTKLGLPTVVLFETVEEIEGLSTQSPQEKS